jgi:hypothetical protein
MEIRTELSALGKLINLPPGTRAVRWAVLPRGSAGLGPSDYTLHAYIELDDTGLKVFEQQGGNPSAASTLWMPEEVARLLLPPQLHPSATPVNGAWSITGHEFDSQSLARMPYQIDEAIRVTSGLLVIASTR